MAKRSPVCPDAAAHVMRDVGLEPLCPYPGAREPWLCRCTRCGLEVRPTYDNVRGGKSSGCVSCGRKVAAVKHRANGEAAALQLAALRGLEPLKPYSGVTSPWLCRCLKCGGEVSPTPHQLKREGGCWKCGQDARSATQRGPEDRAIEDLRAAGFSPLTPFPGVMNPWPCECSRCGRHVTQLLNAIRNGSSGGGCRWCLRLAVEPEEAAAVMRAADLEPLEAYPGSDTPWRCRCLRCGRSPSPRYSTVRLGGGEKGRCGYCAKRVVEPIEAVELMRSANLEPLEPYISTKHPWKCRCTRCDRVVHPPHSQIQSGAGGCRWCQVAGFKLTEPALVYLIVNSALGAVKVGVGHPDGPRLSQHRRRGWDAVAAVRVIGERALAIEEDILNWWRHDLGLPTYLSREDMPHGGWTETAELDEVDVVATIQRIKRLSCADSTAAA